MPNLECLVALIGRIRCLKPFERDPEIHFVTLSLDRFHRRELAHCLATFEPGLDGAGNHLRLPKSPTIPAATSDHVRPRHRGLIRRPADSVSMIRTPSLLLSAE